MCWCTPGMLRALALAPCSPSSPLAWGLVPTCPGRGAHSTSLAAVARAGLPVQRCRLSTQSSPWCMLWQPSHACSPVPMPHAALPMWVHRRPQNGTWPVAPAVLHSHAGYSQMQAALTLLLTRWYSSASSCAHAPRYPLVHRASSASSCTHAPRSPLTATQVTPCSKEPMLFIQGSCAPPCSHVHYGTQGTHYRLLRQWHTRNSALYRIRSRGSG
jgi:hypothetical protein